ncbi:hypothetical protein D3C71_328860 [compost metagenome]
MKNARRPRLPRHKLRAASRSMTVWFSALVPILLAAAEALRDQLPQLSEYLAGWKMVVASVVVSAIVAALRVRSVTANFDVETPNFDVETEADAKAGARSK